MTAYCQTQRYTVEGQQGELQPTDRNMEHQAFNTKLEFSNYVLIELKKKV